MKIGRLKRKATSSPLYQLLFLCLCLKPVKYFLSLFVLLQPLPFVRLPIELEHGHPAGDGDEVRLVFFVLFSQFAWQLLEYPRLEPLALLLALLPFECWRLLLDTHATVQYLRILTEHHPTPTS